MDAEDKSELGEDRGRYTPRAKRGRIHDFEDSSGITDPRTREAGGDVSKACKGRSVALVDDDKAEFIRHRNCENARKARARKKVEVMRLQEQAAQLKHARVRKREAAKKAREFREETEKARRQTLRTFLHFRCTNERDYQKWATIVEESFTMTLPITPYRWFSSQDVLNNSRVLFGIEHLMTDTGSLAVLIESLGSGTLPWRRQMEKGKGHGVSLTCDIGDDDIMIAKDTLMCCFLLRTTNAVEHGAKTEWLCRGMMQAKFSPLSGKLSAIEHVFDVTTLMQQLQRVIGDEQEMPVVPNTPSGACKPSKEARVITMATPPYKVVRCNEAWQKLCGYTQEMIQGRSLKVLQGPKTDQGAIAEMRHEITRGHAASTLLVNYKNDGRQFLNYLRVYPLVADDVGNVTHLLGILQEQAEESEENEKGYSSFSKQREKQTGIDSWTAVAKGTSRDTMPLSSSHYASLPTLPTDESVQRREKGGNSDVTGSHGRPSDPRARQRAKASEQEWRENSQKSNRQYADDVREGQTAPGNRGGDKLVSVKEEGDFPGRSLHDRNSSPPSEKNLLTVSAGGNSDSSEMLLAWEDVLAGSGDPLGDLGMLNVEEELDDAGTRVTTESSEQDGDERGRARSDSIMAVSDSMNRTAKFAERERERCDGVQTSTDTWEEERPRRALSDSGNWASSLAVQEQPQGLYAGQATPSAAQATNASKVRGNGSGPAAHGAQPSRPNTEGKDLAAREEVVDMTSAPQASGTTLRRHRDFVAPSANNVPTAANVAVPPIGMFDGSGLEGIGYENLIPSHFPPGAMDGMQAPWPPPSGITTAGSITGCAAPGGSLSRNMAPSTAAAGMPVTPGGAMFGWDNPDFTGWPTVLAAEQMFPPFDVQAARLGQGFPDVANSSVADISSRSQAMPLGCERTTPQNSTTPSERW